MGEVYSGASSGKRLTYKRREVALAGSGTGISRQEPGSREAVMAAGTSESVKHKATVRVRIIAFFIKVDDPTTYYSK